MKKKLKSFLSFWATFTLAMSLASHTTYAAPKEEKSNGLSSPPKTASKTTTLREEWIEIDDKFIKNGEIIDESQLDKYYQENGDVKWDRVVAEMPSQFNYNAKRLRGNRERSNSDNPELTPQELNPHGCELVPYGRRGYDSMSLHKRSSSSRWWFGILGWKPVTRCVTAPRYIRHTNIFYRTTVFGIWIREARGKDGRAWNAKQYRQMNIEYLCGSFKSEVWRGVTNSTILAKNNKVYYRRLPTNILKVNCGIR